MPALRALTVRLGPACAARKTLSTAGVFYHDVAAVLV